MNKLLLKSLIVALVVMSLGLTVAAQDVTVVTFTCYQDGNECEVYRDLLDRFEAENPDIVVEMGDPVPYQDILDVLPIAVESGEGPDIARVTNFTLMSPFYLDMRPYMEDPSILEDNFSPAIVAAFRKPGSEDNLSGFTDATTITGPFVNATLFEQAGVELLGEGATWEEWMEALTEVRDATGIDYAFAMDGRGHRFAGPAMSMGATFFDEDFNFDLEGDEGFEAMAAMLKDWLDAGLVPAESWASGDTYVDAREYMFNVQSPMHFSGSWQIGAYASTIGDDFDWVVVPNPTGPGGSTGVMGGAALVAFETGDETQSEATTRVMEYLLQPEVYAEFSGRTLNIPAHAGAVEVGVEYDTDDERVAAALAQFSAEAAKLEDQAINLTLHPWNFVYYSSANTRLSQYFTGELTVEEAVAAIQADIDDAVANAESS